MVIKGNKENIKKYLIKNKDNINITNCKFGKIEKDQTKEEETTLSVTSKDLRDPHTEFSLSIFKTFGV